MKINSGTKWPFIITGMILGLIALCVWTIIVTNEDPVEESHLYMTYYQKADKDANLIIKDRILFNKNFDVSYISKKLKPQDTVIQYKITHKDGMPIDDAKVKIILTRPTTNRFNIDLNQPSSVKNGIYTFNTKLSGPGRWNVMAQIRIGRYERYLNIKTDTRDDSYVTREY
jgi:hypothetical protein